MSRSDDDYRDGAPAKPEGGGALGATRSAEGGVRMLRAGLACVLGALVTTATGFAGFVVLTLPGAPGHAYLRGLGSAAARGQDEFLRYIGSPAEAALRTAFMAWYVSIALPVAVIAGSIVAARLSRGSWLCAALGGIAPAAVFVLAGFPTGATPTTGAPGFLAVAVAAWAASIALLHLWSRRRAPRTAAERET